MKLIKYTLVDPISGHVLNPKASAPNGRTHPNLAGLDVKHFLASTEEFLAEISDSTVVDSATGIVVINQQQFNDAVTAEFAAAKDAAKKVVYEYAIQLRHAAVDFSYHSSELAFAASVKIIEANAAKDAANEDAAKLVAPNLTVEAETRGITVKDLADKVIAKFNALAAREATLAGVRGAKVDAIEAVTLDLNDVSGSYAALNTLRMSVGDGW